MKKIVLCLSILLALGGEVAAQQIVVDDVEALASETVSLRISLDTEGGLYTGMEFDIQFPQDGFSTTGNAVVTALWDGAFTIGDVGGVGISNLARSGVMSYSDTTIPGEGLNQLGTVEFVVPSSLPLGCYNMAITNVTLIGDSRVAVPDVIFTLKVVETHIVVLDEASTNVPVAAAGVNVRVRRTIKAGEWSTICLPFAMSEAQVKVAFGDDVQLGDFNDYEYVDATDAIRVNFQCATAIEANHPYIIKVSTAVSEFTVDGVDIDPQEAIVDFDTSRRKNQPRQFVGTYVANTVLDWGTLFLSDNQFWYSTGNTKMKAFRAYFNLNDLIPDFEDNYESRVSMVFGDDITTGISLSPSLSQGEGAVYDLQGRRVDEPKAKGIYIVNGKKIKK